MKMIPCAFHPTLPLVNFCKRPECLLPLCPSCVKVHAEQHEGENTHGLFDNISDVHKGILFDLQSILKSLVDCSQDLKEVLTQKQDKKQMIKRRMNQMKQRIIKNIDHFIVDLEKQILNSLGGAQDNIEQDFTIIDNQIQSLSKEIHKEISLLEGDKVLKGIIQHYADQKKQFYHSEIETIEQKIQRIEEKDLTICKQFKINQMTNILDEVRTCYKSVFVGSIRASNNRKTMSRMQSLKSSRLSETN